MVILHNLLCLTYSTYSVIEADYFLKNLSLEIRDPSKKVSNMHAVL